MKMTAKCEKFIKEFEEIKQSVIKCMDIDDLADMDADQFICISKLWKLMNTSMDFMRTQSIIIDDMNFKLDMLLERTKN